MNQRFARGAHARLRIIRAAADLFHQKGARATSPDEIIEASQTGKGQFYYYFRNKEDLVHEVLQAYLQAIETGTSQIDYELNSWRDLEQWFATHLKLQERYAMTRGCPFGTLGSEVSPDDELIRQDVSLIFEVVKHKLAAFFLKEKAKGRLTNRADPQRMADFCLATIQGGMLMGKVKRSSEPVEAAAKEAVAHVRSYVVNSSRSTRQPAHSTDRNRLASRPPRR
jgi:AcrR family transcriptional regulator